MPSRLKSLELHGYKTFASRTNFEFPGPITAIVGPNGSGKSNVSDAMRWVLGEQSFSLLRGRKTEDMIFSGSELRPRAGMASATITFDNTDGWLPIDYSEVSITRRAYRDGQNEYLLNGQRVRLREISELLAQSGLAERTYTIIGQGLVDAALALKPEERRRLFEEAAGIGLYRTRREDALNRLEHTRRNLERVQDILAELEPRLKSLEKQAKRAQEYERVRADLRLLLRDWYGYHWHRHQQELVRSREGLKGQEARLDAARSREAEAGEKVSVLRAQISELRAKLNGWHAELAQQHQEQERLSRALAISDERQHSLLELRQNLHNDQVRVEEEAQALEARLQAALAEQAHFEGDSQEAQSQVDAARQALLGRQVERARVEKLLRETRQRLSATENRQVELRARQSELARRQADQQKSIASIAEAIKTGENELEKAQARLDAAQKERSQADMVRQKLAAELQTYRQGTSELETRRRKIIEERSSLETIKARQQAQLDVLVQAEQSFTGLGAGTRFLMQSRKQGQLNGMVHTLSQHLEVPAEYEAAIAAALGEYLDLVLLDQDSDPEQALTLLSSGEKGRAAMLPLAWLRNEPGQPPVSDPGLVGPACELIRTNDLHPGAVQALLGAVWIVQDRHSARRVAAQLPPNGRAVTLRGDVFWANGSVVSGKENRSDHSLLGRARQKRELQEAVEETGRKIEANRAQLRGVEEELNQRRDEESRLDKESRQAGQRFEKAGEAVQTATLAREQARRQLDWQTNQRKSLDLQVSQAQSEAAQTSQELAGQEKRLSELREENRTINASLAALPLDELQAQVAHWTTSAAVTARALQDAQKRVEEQRAGTRRYQDQLRSLAARLVEIGQQYDQIEKDKVVSREQEGNLSEKIRQMQEHIQPAERNLEVMEKEYENLQQVEDATQQALTVAERYYTQAQLEVTRQREAVESLQRRIEEDFGLVAFQYGTDVAGQDPLPFEGMVEQLPVLNQIPPELEDSIARIRGQIRRMGAINPDALVEYEGVLERYQFMTTQVADLRKADGDLRQVIDELDELMRREFKKTFDAVAVEFKGLFTRLFGGGSARLILSDGDHPTEAGIDIEARLPGRREQGLSLLSGGERSLTAVALVFSLLKVAPTPFCIMDEVDAMLDEANVGRFRDLLIDLSKTTQFIVITHNRNTVQAADIIYGITMGKDSASQMISLRLEEVPEEMAQ